LRYRGESATGKSEIYRMLVRHFCDISKIQTKKTKAHSLIVKASSILAAFGNATTPYNPDATCFTQYTEIQFNQKGKMVGAKLIEYLLEKTRVNNPLDGGRTFHIFYYMLEGANNEERSLLNLYDAAHFNYLAGSDIVGYELLEN
jgi:chitin synthase